MRKTDKLERALFNKKVSIRSLLMKYGFLGKGDPRSSIYCPFHFDREGGHKSAKILDEKNILYCFSERKFFTPADLVEFMGEEINLMGVEGSVSVPQEPYDFKEREEKERLIIESLRSFLDGKR